MIYIEYIDYRKKYYEAQKRYDNILSEKEKLFAITQPKTTRTDTSRVSGGHSENTFDTYLIQKEEKQIDARLEEVRSILEDRKTLLKAKEEELKHSKDWLDIIYVYYHIENLSIRKIAKRIPFSTTEIFRKLKKIEKSIK